MMAIRSSSNQIILIILIKTDKTNFRPGSSEVNPRISGTCVFELDVQAETLARPFKTFLPFFTLFVYWLTSFVAILSATKSLSDPKSRVL